MTANEKTDSILIPIADMFDQRFLNLCAKQQNIFFSPILHDTRNNIASPTSDLAIPQSGSTPSYWPAEHEKSV